MINTVSFDVFDTLITRKVARPVGIFVIMREKLLIDSKYASIPFFLKDNFINYRTSSETYQRIAYMNTWGLEEISFDAIYTNMKKNYNLSDDVIELLKELELETELENILPLPKNIALLKEFLKKGKDVFLISDMYHSSEFIKKLLTKADPELGNIELFVSSEYKVQKSSGKLYHKVKELKKLDFHSWIHYGDNAHSDVKIAKNLGIKAIHTPIPPLESYENRALELASSYAYLTVGCSQYTKRNYDGNEYYNLGVSLAGPIVLPFILWLLDWCEKEGIRRLYFIARDGYVLKEIADLIIKEHKLSINTKYIYSSRFSWQLPSFAVSKDNIDKVIEQYGRYNTFLAPMLNLSVKQLKSLLPMHLLKRNSWNYQSIQNMLKDLRKDDRLYEYLKKNNESKLENLKKYIKQEIDFSDEYFAFVDVDSAGNTLSCLASIVDGLKKKQIKQFCIRSAMWKRYYENIDSKFYIDRFDSCTFLELLFRAPHGMTLGYKYVADKIEPILDDTHINYDFESYTSGIKDFAKNYLNFGLDINNSVVNSYLDFLDKSIDKKLADIFGKIIFNHGGGLSETEVAPKITKFKALRHLLGFKLDTKYYRMSYLRSSKGAQRILNYKPKADKIRNRILALKNILKVKK